MVIFPKENPVIENLNSCYTDINRLLTYYQGKMASGCVHFKSGSAEGIVFFHHHGPLGGVYLCDGSKYVGDDTIDRIIKDCADTEFGISVYGIEPDRIRYWSQIASAHRIYDNLSTEFTDLQGLIKKMGKEMLSGYIEVGFAQSDKQAWIFLQQGTIIGGFDSWERHSLDRSAEYLKQIIARTKNDGGTFRVSKLAEEQDVPLPPADMLPDLEALLVYFEDRMKSADSNGANFDRDFRHVLMDHAERYPFLDPFAGEFNYAGQKLAYEGDADDKDLIEGTLTCMLVLAKDKGIFDLCKNEMIRFLDRHGQGIKIDGLTE